MSHYACYIDERGRTRRNLIPEGNYAKGDLITVRSGTFRITGGGHYESYGARMAARDVSWPAKPIDPTEIPRELTRDPRD